MTKKAWFSKIKAMCEGVGTYKTEFDAVIETLADLLEKRDDTIKKYKESGGEPVIVERDENGEVEKIGKKNPYVLIILEYERVALSYWRDLGLTPAGLRKIDDELMKPRKLSPLAEALKEFG